MPQTPLHQMYQQIAMSPLARRELDGSAIPAESAGFVTLHDAILARASGLHALEEVKDYAKGRYLLDKQASAEQRTVYLAVYLAAIAAALRWHATSITRLPVVQLAAALVWASRQDWLPDPIRRLCDPKRLIDVLTRNMARNARAAR